MENTGLSISGYNDNYYYLRSGGVGYAPGVTGKLYRRYTCRDEGLRERRTWTTNDSMQMIAAIITGITGFPEPITVILSVVQFANGMVKFNQTVETRSYGFNYRYKVRVGGSVYFATDRQVSYWKIFNVNTGQYNWSERRWDGYTGSNDMMISSGVDEYLSGKPVLTYQTHVQNDGWQNIRSEGDLSGTSGRSLRLEGIKIYLNDNKWGGTVEYQTHVQNLGWQNWVSNGAMSGTSGKGLRLEAIRIRLTGGVSNKYRLKYRVHVQDSGWQDWKYDGQTAGTTGSGKRLEAIEIRMIRK